MAEQTRETLSKYFQAGELPTQGHFDDLIDSMLNMKDEGFRKSAKNGVEIASLGNEDALLSLYRDSEPTRAKWALRFGTDDRLQWGSVNRQVDKSVPAVLTLHSADVLGGVSGATANAASGTTAGTTTGTTTGTVAQARVGINTALPEHTLDVAGVVAAQGRVGSYRADKVLSAPADGDWHDILTGLQGCHAFEVMAGVGGGQRKGRFALLHAVALNTYQPNLGWFDFLSPKRRIRQTSAHYGRRCDRLHLCWEATEGPQGAERSYRLRIKTGCSYDSGVSIRFSITQLWFDTHMTACPDNAPAPGSAAGAAATSGAQ